MQLVPIFTTANAIPSPNSAEGILISTPPVEVPRDSCMGFVFATLGFVPGASTTLLTFNIRRGIGALTDPIVYTSGSISGGFTVGLDSQFCLFAPDTLLLLGTAVYSLTVAQASGTAPGNGFNIRLGALLFF